MCLFLEPIPLIRVPWSAGGEVSQVKPSHNYPQKSRKKLPRASITPVKCWEVGLIGNLGFTAIGFV